MSGLMEGVFSASLDSSSALSRSSSSRRRFADAERGAFSSARPGTSGAAVEKILPYHKERLTRVAGGDPEV